MAIEFDDGACATQRAWHVLVGCLMLNKTGRKQARAALRGIFDVVRDPGDLSGVSDDVLLPCGLANRRLAALRALTEDWLEGKPVRDMRFCGQYALDSFRIFVEGLPTEIRPDMDSEIKRYLSGMEQSHS